MAGSVVRVGSVAARGFCWCFEGFGEKNDGGSDEGDDADDVEAIHEGEELGLGVELLVDTSVGRVKGVGC